VIFVGEELTVFQFLMGEYVKILRTTGMNQNAFKMPDMQTS